MTVRDPEAVEALARAGAHFVLTQKQGGKAPLEGRSWKKYRPPVEDVLRHKDKGGTAYVGIVPGSIGTR